MDPKGGLRQYIRQEAFGKVRQVPGNHIISDELVPWKLFMSELRNSKLCLSPFGFGELCWRDIEAILSGAVLIKPDMSHLETLPDLYEAEETYLPVRWDYSNFEEVAARALNDKELRKHLARSAWQRVHKYLVEDRFVEDMAPLWEERA